MSTSSKSLNYESWKTTKLHIKIEQLTFGSFYFSIYSRIWESAISNSYSLVRKLGKNVTMIFLVGKRLHRGLSFRHFSPQLREPFLVGNESQTTFWRGIPLCHNEPNYGRLITRFESGRGGGLGYSAPPPFSRRRFTVLLDHVLVRPSKCDTVSIDNRVKSSLCYCV